MATCSENTLIFNNNNQRKNGTSTHAKKIISTMESVINSVKKERRNKKKIYLKSDEPEINNISSVLSSNLSLISPNVSQEHLESSQKDGLNDSLLPLNWKNYILKMSKCESKENKPTTDEMTSPEPAASSMKLIDSASKLTTPKTPKKNAFEMMMNARSQSIGTNSDGKDCLEKYETLNRSTDKSKRKQMLEEWSQRKGGLKRKLDEEASEMYIEKQLNKRAKRLKTLISNGKKRKSRKLIEIDMDDDGDPESLVFDLTDDAITTEKSAKQNRKGKIASKNKKETKLEKSADAEAVQLKEFSKKPKQGKPELKNKKEFEGEMSANVQVEKIIEVNESSNNTKTDQGKLKNEKETKHEKSADAEIKVKTINEQSKLEHERETETKKSGNLEVEMMKMIEVKESSKNIKKEPEKEESTNVEDEFSKKTRNELGSETSADVEAKPKEVIEVKNDDSFLVVLSSPIKKRDSLLGYFNRIKKSDENSKDCIKTPPLSEPPETNSDSKKKIRKKSKSKQSKTVTLKEKNINSASTSVSNEKNPGDREATPPPSPIQRELELTPNGRPKRECRNKQINYSVDIELSPVKIAAKKLLKRARRQLSESPEKQSVNSVRTPTLSHRAQKLAPIFIKSTPKPAVDPAVLKARQEFLMSGIPDCMKLEMEKQRLYEETYEQQIEYFPSISHVTQLKEKNAIITENLTFPINIGRDEEMRKIDEFKKFICGKETPQISLKCKEQPNSSLKLTNAKEVIKKIKEQDRKFHFYRCFKQLQHQFLADIGENVQENDDFDDSVTFVDGLECHLNGTKMFTEKYKPVKTDEILVNFEPVTRLKEFLTTWQNSQNGTRNYDSNDDFDMGGSSSNSGFRTGNFTVLIGPHGCGKTNAVYAVANDLQFKVLEINAGCHRSGKKILRKLQEATQSHQVKNNKNDFKSKFADDAVCVISQHSAAEDSQQFSLILIEDADIFFEQDVGFVEAINQLIITSKRPVILSANQENCAHLTKFIQQNAIYFDQANSTNISKWMSTLAIVEGYYITMEDCKRLYDFNRMDLRKTLLQLQFFIQSKGDWNPLQHKNCTPYQHTGLLKLFSWDQCDPRNETESDIDFSKLRQNCPSDGAPGTTIETRQNQRNYLTNASAIDRLVFKTDKDHSNLSTEIAQEMVRLMTENSIQMNSYYPIKSTPSSRVLLTDDISQETRTQSIHLDYEPCLRSICRAEKNRIKSERRGSRFYHYLRNASSFNIGMNSFSINNNFDQFCDLFQMNESERC